MIPLHELLGRIRWNPEFVHSVPYHRVKEVWKDGALIWHREH